MQRRWTAMTLLSVALATSWALGVTPTNETPRQVPFTLENLPVEHRESVRRLLERPTLTSSGAVESIVCNPAHYYWLLENPHRAVEGWKSFGAACMPISHLGNGHFGWGDETGSTVTWTTIARSPEYRVWYAQGKVRSSKLMPFMPVQGMVIMHHIEAKTPTGDPVIHQHADLFVLTESRALTLTAKLFGTSANRVAEQGIEQLQFFFSGLSRLLARYPDRADELFQTSRTQPSQ